MTPTKARDLGAPIRPWPHSSKRSRWPSQADREMRQAQRWLTYAMVMAQASSKDGGEQQS